MSRNFYYRLEAEIVAGSANFAARISASPEAYGLTEAQAASFGALNAAMQSAYSAAIEPVTRTPVAIEAKNLAIASVRESALNLGRIAYSTLTMTDAQLMELGLQPRAKRTPIPPPSVRPGVSVLSVNVRTVSVRLYDGESGARRAKPPGVVAALFYSFVGTEYPADPKAWKFEGSTSRSKFDIVFPDAVAGGTQVWIRAAWINGRQQLGPMSVPIATPIQGGGASAAPAGIKMAA